MFIRKVKNQSGNIAFQVVEKIGRKNHVIKHLGTARNQLEEYQLLNLGQQYLDRERLNQGRLSFFDNRYPQTDWEKFLTRFAFTPHPECPDRKVRDEWIISAKRTLNAPSVSSGCGVY